MGRGVAKAGLRRPPGWAQMDKDELAKIMAEKAAAKGLEFKRGIGFEALPNYHVEAPREETDEQVLERINQRFDVLATLVDTTLDGDCRSLIISGPPGFSKSHTIDQKIAERGMDESEYRVIKGYVRATGLFKMLYQHRHEGSIVVFDDADSIFFDDTSLNMLKAVCDTTERRFVSYLAEYDMVDEEGEDIPRTFEFEGTIIFITNYDFDAMIARGHKLAPHMLALISRSNYVDLTLRNRRDYLLRIKQVCEESMFDNLGLNAAMRKDVLSFMTAHRDEFRELSLRTAIKISKIRKSTPKAWEKIAVITTCKGT